MQFICPSCGRLSPDADIRVNGAYCLNCARVMNEVRGDLVKFRMAKGLSQSQAANLIGKSRSLLCKIEKGTVVASSSVMQKLLKLYRVEQ